MIQSEEKLRGKVLQLRSDVLTLQGTVRGQNRRIAYLESQLKDPRAHEKHLEDVYRAVREAYYCILKDEGAWKHEGNGDACLAELANLIPDSYFSGVRKKAESIRWPILETAAVCGEGRSG